MVWCPVQLVSKPRGAWCQNPICGIFEFPVDLIGFRRLYRNWSRRLQYRAMVVEVLRQCWWWLSEWVTPRDTAMPGMTSLKDGDLQHSSALAQSPKESPTIRQKLIRIRTADGCSRWYVQYRVDHGVSVSLSQRPRSLLTFPLSLQSRLGANIKIKKVD